MSKLKDTLVDGSMKIVNDLTLGGVYLNNLTKGDVQLKLFSGEEGLLKVCPEYNANTTLREIVSKMPDYSILTYYVNEQTVPSNELKTLTGGALTMQVVIHRLVSQRIIIYVHLSGLPTIYYKSDRLDKEENTINWSIMGKGNWNVATLLNGWKQYSNTTDYCPMLQYRRENNRVFFRGIIMGGASNQMITTLPVGYRPSKTKILTSIYRATITGAHIIAQIEIYKDGGILMRCNESDANHSNIAWLSFDGLSYDLD